MEKASLSIPAKLVLGLLGIGAIWMGTAIFASDERSEMKFLFFLILISVWAFVRFNTAVTEEPRLNTLVKPVAHYSLLLHRFLDVMLVAFVTGFAGAAVLSSFGKTL